MAQNIITEIVSDFSGKPGETVPFTFNGTEMTVDLDNLERHNFERMIAAHEDKIAALEAEFAAKMEKYVEVAKVVNAPKARRSNTDEPAKIREWARANGYEVKDRGRIHADIVTAYKKRNTKKTETPAPETETEAEAETTEA